MNADTRSSSESAPGRVRTYEALQRLGFAYDAKKGPERMDGLGYNFGNFQLSAVLCVNRWLTEGVVCSGVFATPRVISEVEFELPLWMDSVDQCAAWVAWELDRQTDVRGFRPQVHVPWLATAREHRALVPYVKSRLDYEAEERTAPKCVVAHAWLKVAISGLKQHLAALDGAACVAIGFDGRMLTFGCGDKVFPMPAEGTPWADTYRCAGERFRTKLQRIPRRSAEVRVSRSTLYIASSRIGEVAAVSREAEAGSNE